MIKCGQYQHFKGGMYKVTGTRLYVTDGAELVHVDYCCMEDGIKYSRCVADFNAKVQHNGEIVERFKLIKEEAEAKVNLLDLINKNKVIYESQDDPQYHLSVQAKALKMLTGSLIGQGVDYGVLTVTEGLEQVKLLNEWRS